MSAHGEQRTMSGTGRRGIVVLCLGMALLTAAAAALGVFGRGDGTFEAVVSARGESYRMATTGVYAYNALRVAIYALSLVACAWIIATSGRVAVAGGADVPERGACRRPLSPLVAPASGTRQRA